VSLSKSVVDSSVVLAIVYRETGWETVVEFLDEAVMSSVNLAEVQGKLVGRGMPSDAAWEAIFHVVSRFELFDAEQGRIAGDLILKTRAHGLSLGDRACLALGVKLGLPVYTMDRAWKGLKIGVKVHVLR
jgi:ribonuclease VapC